METELDERFVRAIEVIAQVEVENRKTLMELLEVFKPLVDKIINQQR